MHSYYSLLIHIWFGTVAAVNFIFIPVLLRQDIDTKAKFITSFFPRLFRYVTVLASIIFLFGMGRIFIWKNLTSEKELIGFVFLTLLTMFHVIVEQRLRTIAIGFAREYSQVEVEKFCRYLRVIPRLGFTVITLSVVLLS